MCVCMNRSVSFFFKKKRGDWGGGGVGFNGFEEMKRGEGLDIIYIMGGFYVLYM